MSFFTVNSNQDINDMLAYDLYRSFQSAFETIKQNGGTFEDVKNICDSFLPIDKTHPDTIDTPIPDIKDCRGDVIISCKYNMIGVALIGHFDGEPNIKDFEIADAYHAFYKDTLTKQYYFHDMQIKYANRDMFLQNPNMVMEDPLMNFIENEVPFRLEEIHDIKKASPEMIENIVLGLQEDTDILLDYDAMDDYIDEQLNHYHEEYPLDYYNAKLGLSLTEMPKEINMKLSNGQFVTVTHMGQELGKETGQVEDIYRFALYDKDAVSEKDTLKVFEESGYEDIFMFFENMLHDNNLQEQNTYDFLDSMESIFKENRNKSIHKPLDEIIKNIQTRVEDGNSKNSLSYSEMSK